MTEGRSNHASRTGLLGVAIATVLATCAVALLPRQADAQSATTRATARQALSPSKFAEVSSGVTLIRAFPCRGRRYFSGSGFLIGDRIVMTARHVVDPPEGPKLCRIRVRVKGQWVGVASWNWWYSQRPSDGRLVDLAALKLDRRVDAHLFRIRPTPVPLGTNLAMVGHPLGNKLSITQGRLLGRKRISGVPRILVNLLGAEGASGSAFLDDQGNVVGVLQQGLGGKDVFGQATSGAIVGLDLNSWWGNGKRYLCRAYPNGGIPMCGARPKPARPPAAPPTAPPTATPPPAPSSPVLDDPVGDSGAAADISRSSVTVDAQGSIVIRTTLTALLGDRQNFRIYIDTDQNPKTGYYGAEYLLTDGPHGYDFERWNGSALEHYHPSSLRSLNEGTALTLVVGRSDIGSPSTLRLILLSTAYDTANNTLGTDDAPDGSSAADIWWTVRLT